MAEACVNLAAKLQLVTRDTPEGRLFSLSGTLVAAAVCLPEFYRQASKAARGERLVVGVPSPHEVYLAADDSPAADAVRRVVRESDYEAVELVPFVLSIMGDRIEVLEERS